MRTFIIIPTFGWCFMCFFLCDTNRNVDRRGVELSKWRSRKKNRWHGNKKLYFNNIRAERWGWSDRLRGGGWYDYGWGPEGKRRRYLNWPDRGFELLNWLVRIFSYSVNLIRFFFMKGQGIW